MTGRKRARAEDDTSDTASSKLIGAINRCFSTEDGKHVLKLLGSLCGWKETSVIKPEPGIDILLTTYYNEARRAVYLELRDLIRDDILKEVEFHKETESKEDKE